MRPAITTVLTVYDRPLGVLTKSLGALREQGHDRCVIVLDRSPEPVASLIRGYAAADHGRTEVVEIVGKPGWLCPAKAWNEGFARVKTELVYCFSSEVINDRGNVEGAVQLLESRPAVVFGACEDDGPVGLVVSDRPNVLCDSRMPRPLGFIWAAPMSNVRQIGGFDERFMNGYWFDDDDFFFRLWQTGIPFVFDDSIHGVHQHHERPVLETAEGKAGINANAWHMVKKHCDLHPLIQVAKKVHGTPGQTWWEHA